MLKSLFQKMFDEVVLFHKKDLQERFTHIINEVAQELDQIQTDLVENKKEVENAITTNIELLRTTLKDLQDQLKANQLTQLEKFHTETQLKELLKSQLQQAVLKAETLEKQLNFLQNRVLQVPFKRTDDRAQVPTRAYSNDAGWDVYAIEDVYIPTGEQREVKIGLAFETPSGYHIQIHTRSSHGKKMLRCHLGIVDAGYRNELSIWMSNFGHDGYQIKAGDKVCQLLFLPVPSIDLHEVKELNKSERGMNGHGSSGR